MTAFAYCSWAVAVQRIVRVAEHLQVRKTSSQVFRHVITDTSGNVEVFGMGRADVHR